MVQEAPTVLLRRVSVVSRLFYCAVNSSSRITTPSQLTLPTEPNQKERRGGTSNGMVIGCAGSVMYNSIMHMDVDGLGWY
jgi:hypothetical protein